MNPTTHSKPFIKKFLVVSAVTFLLGLASHASAQGFVPLAPIPGLTEGGVANSGNLADFFNNLYKYLIGLAAVLAVIEIIWGGLEISTQDSVSKQQDGKERIRQAIFGLVLVLSPVLVFSIINPSILNLSLNLQKLDLATPPVTTTKPTTLSGPTPDGATDIIQENKKYTDRFYPCSGGDCSAAKTLCKNDPQAVYQLESAMKIVCLSKDGSVDSSGRTFYSRLPGTDYACAAGETANVRCIMK